MPRRQGALVAGRRPRLAHFAAVRAEAGFVRGLSTRDVQAALTEALGEPAAVSKSTVSRICADIKEQFDTWCRRRLEVTPGRFTSVLGTQLSRMRLGIEAAEFGLPVLGPRPRRTAGACRGLPRFLRVLHPYLPRRVNADVD